MRQILQAPVACCLAWLATAGLAQPAPSAMVAEPLLPFRPSRIFIGYHDSATQRGDVLAVHDVAAAEAPLWRATDRLEPRLASTTVPRQIVAAPGWERLAARLRATPLGAILNANLWYVGSGAAGRSPMVYAGAHDGMLHGFAADDGQEHFAYVPRGLAPRLASGIPGAVVDGPLFGGVAPTGPGGAAQPLLAVALGAGGKGLAVLDVSAPETFTADRVLVDLSDADDPDLGHITSPPVLEDDAVNRSRHFVRMHGGRPALVFGNGHGSRTGRPVLLIQYLDLGRELIRISPCSGTGDCAYAGDNGLAMPRLLDLDGDGRVDLGYAGDLQGQLWKFDLRGPEDGWHVAFDGKPLFTACDAHGRRQPITTAPYTAPHPQGGLMLVVGTGRNIGARDSADNSPQSVYGLHDDNFTGGLGTLQASTAACARPASLTPRSYGAPVALGTTEYYSVASPPPDGAGTSPPRGWFIDLPAPGQRVLQNPRAFEGRKLLVHSLVPTGAPGHPRIQGHAYLSVLNLLTGNAPAVPAFAVPDETLTALPLGMARLPPGGPWLLQRRTGEQVQLQPAQGSPVRLLATRTAGARAGWREGR